MNNFIYSLWCYTNIWNTIKNIPKIVIISWTSTNIIIEFALSIATNLSLKKLTVSRPWLHNWLMVMRAVSKSFHQFNIMQWWKTKILIAFLSSTFPCAPSPKVSWPNPPTTRTRSYSDAQKDIDKKDIKKTRVPRHCK